ncbi:tautomerase family protein [Mesorhizobium sp. CU2]|uniref:tautomerase family protein n=1 Tax=unclassified Mesorhizobium TaxID=325217 RepID=UPI001127105E|nr:MULTISPECIES: tautomerase family protein [unclassified Mesorhizobium]TPN89711.1 tautomerase family protein [Mesorhizobium sp. CU3]TPO21391.1 tautomerase family protein [Mesorhizobium sp. CU2]
MPLVRISIPASKGDAFAKAVSESVHDAMVATIDAPQTDRFQIVTEHAPGWLILDPTYLGVDRSADALIVHITLRAGRSDDKKRALYRTIAENLHARLGVRKQDIMIVLAENASIDWSFGNGEAQYAKD